MTGKEAERIVRERYPKAVCRKYMFSLRDPYAGHDFSVYPSRRWDASPISDHATTRDMAWKDAARRLTGEPT